MPRIFWRALAWLIYWPLRGYAHFTPLTPGNTGFTKRGVVIGQPDNPYLSRWYLIPRNERYNIYLHRFHRSDDDRALHDHPWGFHSLVLQGNPSEIFYSPQLDELFEADKRLTYNRAFSPGELVFRPATHTHRVIIEPEQEGRVWTLVITGPKIRAWGFHCPKGWVHWRKFTGIAKDGYSIGAGCGED